MSVKWAQTMALRKWKFCFEQKLLTPFGKWLLLAYWAINKKEKTQNESNKKLKLIY